jgi:purine-cytosine permease-like protein
VTLLPNFVIWLIFLGYIVGENVLAGQALVGFTHISYAEAVAVTSFVTWLVVFFGYRIMHYYVVRHGRVNWRTIAVRHSMPSR